MLRIDSRPFSDENMLGMCEEGVRDVSVFCLVGMLLGSRMVGGWSFNGKLVFHVFLNEMSRLTTPVPLHSEESQAGLITWWVNLKWLEILSNINSLHLPSQSRT